METTVTTTRDRIVTYAETVKDRGGTYKEAAEKLGVSTSTLRRYRKGETSPRGDVEAKMKRGGKLTQLEQYEYGEREGGGVDDGDQGAPDTVEFEDAAGRAYLPEQAMTRLGRGMIDMDISDAEQLEVKARLYETDRDRRWVVGGESDAGDLVETRKMEFGVSDEDELQEMTQRIRDRMAEQNILYSDENE
jgi:transcriptional regulator with XRE-family HTH domain